MHINPLADSQLNFVRISQSKFAAYQNADRQLKG